MTIWLYHINPTNKRGYTYENWDVSRPKTLLRKGDKKWTALQMFNQVQPDDLICVFMKNIQPNPDGVYLVGRITEVDRDARNFVWEPDAKLSALTLSKPVPKHEVKVFFGRSHGSGMQRLPLAKHRKWLKRLGKGEIIDGMPLVKARGKPPASRPNADPAVSKENGIFGEKVILKLLRKRYPASKGFVVAHISDSNSASDHDIAVLRGEKVVRHVEVKTRVGRIGDPVIISERELACRRANTSRHSIFVVYLGTGKVVRSIAEIGDSDDFALAPRQHWLTPGIPGADTNG
jgi:hypothetical protein